MKRIFGFILVLGLLFFIFQFGITQFKKNHLVVYEIKIGDQDAKITEEYIKTKEDDYYLMKVDFEDNVYIFDVNNSFNKQKHIIDNFEIYKEGVVTCLSPVYIKNNDDPQIICNNDGIQTSYFKIREEYNLDSFTSTLKNFNSQKYESNNEKVALNNNYIYKNNLYDDEYLIVYNYKDLIKLSKDIREKIEFSSYDIYHNEMGILIDKYYILPKFENKPEYSGMWVIDILSKVKKEIKFDKAISTNVYINGVVDNKLYIFDKSNFIQYEINPSKNSYRIVGNKQTSGQYYDGKWSNKNIYDFYSDKIVFNEIHPIKDNYVESFETNKYYYYYNDNNEFYKVYKDWLDNPILLFTYDDKEQIKEETKIEDKIEIEEGTKLEEIKELKEVKVVNDHIYFIVDNTIYRYDDTGIKEIVTNNEFNYNYENIYGVYYK